MRFTNEYVGKGLLEKTACILICNVTLVLLLISYVKRLIVLELSVCKHAFLTLLMELKSLENNRFLLSYVEGLSESTDVMPEYMPGIAVTFMSMYGKLSCKTSSNIENRARVTLEYMHNSAYAKSREWQNELSLARELRHIIISEFDVFNHSWLRSIPDILKVTDRALFDVPGMYTFKSPLWFGSYKSNVIAEMVLFSTRRRRILSRIEEKARKKRAAKRLPSLEVHV